MILIKARTRLFVAIDNSDTVLVIDTDGDHVVDEINTTAPLGRSRIQKI